MNHVQTIAAAGITLTAAIATGARIPEPDASKDIKNPDYAYSRPATTKPSQGSGTITLNGRLDTVAPGGRTRTEFPTQR